VPLAECLRPCHAVLNFRGGVPAQRHSVSGAACRRRLRSGCDALRPGWRRTPSAGTARSRLRPRAACDAFRTRSPVFPFDI
jgi:hypothetical protein